MTIHIYGDSFGASCDNENAWPNVLQKLKDEALRVNAKCGTGPNYSFRVLLNQLEDKKIKNFDTIIFFTIRPKKIRISFFKR